MILIPSETPDRHWRKKPESLILYIPEKLKTIYQQAGNGPSRRHI